VQKNIIAYVDDIVVMSKNEEDHIVDLKKIFTNLRAAGLKLNPKSVSSALVEEGCSGTS
jgi:ABC-type uncharacterized transport system substrate-binding protein